MHNFFVYKTMLKKQLVLGTLQIVQSFVNCTTFDPKFDPKISCDIGNFTQISSFQGSTVHVINFVKHKISRKIMFLQGMLYFGFLGHHHFSCFQVLGWCWVYEKCKCSRHCGCYSAFRTIVDRLLHTTDYRLQTQRKLAHPNISAFGAINDAKLGG